MFEFKVCVYMFILLFYVIIIGFRYLFLVNVIGNSMFSSKKVILTHTAFYQTTFKENWFTFFTYCQETFATPYFSHNLGSQS